MSENLKTRREHLQKLPLQKRLQAMENIRRKDLFSQGVKKTLEMECHIDLVLAGCFTYQETRQGHSYWWSINCKYYGYVK